MGGSSLVRFAPAGSAVEVAPGVTVLEAAVSAGVVIPAPCGGKGACGRCAVTVVEGELEPASEREVAALARARADASRVRLACMARIAGPVTVRPRATTGRTATPVAPRTTTRVVAGVDLGTTSVAAQLIDTATHAVAGTSRVANRQAVFGADVLSRISVAISGRSEELREAAEESIAEAVTYALGAVDVDAVPVDRVVIAGNTAMISLLAGAEVSGLASHPFSHALSSVRLLESRRLSEAIPGAEIVVVPPIAAFVGGDLVAGMLAEGLAGPAEETLFVDIGTNAEVAAVAGDELVVASAPAGPAFEGWGIACGGQAGAGGIVRVLPADEGGLRPVVEAGPATHLTGSGLISTVALLTRAGHLDADGLLHRSGPVQDRFFTSEGVTAVALGDDPNDRTVFITQLDVRALQSAKAAVCVALRTIASSVSIGGGQLRACIVTGAFGGALEPRDLVELGIVPADTATVLRYAPDAALRGAAAMALDWRLMEDAANLARRATHLDLASGESFTAEFVRCLRLEPFTL